MTDDINIYYKLELTDRDIQKGKHRDDVGGIWYELGKLQFQFLFDQGLRPADTLLDIGCGCFRGGIHFIRYLNPGNYYGIDINQSLLDAGYHKELKEAGLQWKVPRKNILCNEAFQSEIFGVKFNYAIAISVFTHLPLDIIQCCLIETAKVMKKGGKFFATIFEVPKTHPAEKPFTHEPGGITTYQNKDPYHYYVDTIEKTVKGMPWEFRYIGDWNHPRAQKMLCFVKT